MKKILGVFTKDDMLYQKIYLILRDNADFSVTRGDVGADILLAEVGEVHSKPQVTERVDAQKGATVIRMSRGNDADLKIPFCEQDLISVLSGKGDTRAELTLGERCAYLHGEKIKLTEVEFSLLSMLYNRDGYISREKLMQNVWGGSADGGVLNVYIHYLREKLEFAGEKVIISSRKHGYKIDEKYL